MTLPKARRDRGRILTDKGSKKIWGAIYYQFLDGYTYSGISDFTQRATNSKARDFVSRDTVSNILQGKAADFGKIESLFIAFGLKLEQDDLTSAAKSPASKSNLIYQDWGEAPDVTVFYGRTEELDKLEEWIVKERCRLVALWGMGGIGKTALSVKLVQQIQDKFEYVIWRSLRHAPLLEDVLEDLLQILFQQLVIDLPTTVGDRLSLLIECLRSHRCLLVLDDWETILASGKPSGYYRDEYKGYGELLARVAEIQHESCLVITSWEKPKKIAISENETGYIRSLQLQGLNAVAARNLFKDKQLSDSEKWDKELIVPYQGHPLALKIVAAMIKDLFAGNVSLFLKEFTFFIDYEMESLLEKQFHRLSKLEIEIMCNLAKAKLPFSISQLRSDIKLEVSRSDLFENLQSLVRRSLIETVPEESENLFTLHPVVMKYVNKHYFSNSAFI